MTAAVRVWWRLRSGEQGASRAPGRLAVTAFAVATAALLVCVAGLFAFRARAEGAPMTSSASLYAGLALIACGLMVVPVLTLGGVAARLAAARRDQRLATLRLTGATSGQVVTMTLVEAAGQAALGGVLGVGLYAALLAPLSRLSFQGRPFDVGELWVGPAYCLLAVLVVVALAVVSGVLGLARVVIGPLGVTSRTTPARLSAIRVAVVGLALVGWLAVSGIRHDLGVGIMVAVLLGVVATINVIGPFVVMLFGHVLARLARRLPTLLAARRLVDDPRSTWRGVGAIGLGVLVAGLSTVLAASAQDSGDGDWQYLATDIVTGSLLTLGIIAAIAATSTGVVQAARVLDQRDEYRALGFAGTDVGIMHAARMREVAIPLLATVLLSAGMCLVLLLPFSVSVGASLLLRLVGAVVISVLVMLLAVSASRSLVRQACAVE